MANSTVNMAKRYLFLVSVAYSFPVLRPLQRAIRERGDEVRWFFDEESGLEAMLDDDEQGDILASAQEVVEYDPAAVFTCGNHSYHFFPGVKVQLFHGYPLNKRNDKNDDHFSLRGWFDIYCTQGPASTIPFEELAKREGYFKVYETGWPKADLYFDSLSRAKKRAETAESNKKPTILYSSTFTRSITSTTILAPHIERMVASGEWNWIFMFHPKLDNPEILERYRIIAERYGNAEFATSSFDMEAMERAEIMLCDTSSIIMEFMMLDKPVVTFRNTRPGRHLIDVTSIEELQPALQEAMYRPMPLMRNIAEYISQYESNIDGKASERVLAAVDDFIEKRNSGAIKLKSKPLNLIRKFKARKKLNFWRW